MPSPDPRPLRRALVALVALLGILATTFAVAPSADAGSGYDPSLGSNDCDLLGRVFVGGRGCARTVCVPQARLYRKVYGAEACQLRGQGDYGFVSTIDFRQCAAIGRRWIHQVNYCASFPDRSATAVYNAPQCTGSRSVYVNLTEADGYFDECLTPQRVRELQLYGAFDGKDLTTEASERSSIQCPWRPEHRYTNGRCVSAPGTRPAQGGTVMIGDSLTWRGTDELARLRPSFTMDGEPARRLSELKGRLDYYISGHGAPSLLIVALGTVAPKPGFSKATLQGIVRSLPRSSTVMLVMPYAERTPGKPIASTVKISGWMRSIARGRSRTCVADWPRFVRTHRGVLQDGIHTTHGNERTWAKFIDRSLVGC